MQLIIYLDHQFRSQKQRKMTEYPDFQLRINQLLEKHEMSQTTLAYTIGVTPQAVQSWCSGRTLINGTNLTKAAKVFGVTESYLLGYE